MKSQQNLILSLTMLCALPCGAMQSLQKRGQLKLPNIPGVITPQEFCMTTLECSNGKLVIENKKLKFLKDLWHKKTDLEIRTIPVDDSVETMGLLLTDIEKIPNEKLIKALLIADKYCARKKTLQTLACKIFGTQQNALEKNPALELLVHHWGKEKINSIETLIKQNKIKTDTVSITINECESLFGIERLACKKEFDVTLRNCQFKKLSLADLIKFFPNLHFLTIKSCVINNLDISALPVHSIFRCTESKVETISAKQNQPLYGCTIELDKSPLTKENLHKLKTFLKPGWRKEGNELTLNLRPNKLTQNNDKKTIMYFDDPLTDLKVHADKKIKQINISHINLKKLSLADLIKLFPNLNSLSISNNTIDNLNLSQMPDHFRLYTDKSQINTITAKPKGNAPIDCKIHFSNTYLPAKEIEKINKFFHRTKWQKLKQQSLLNFALPFIPLASLVAFKSIVRLTTKEILSFVFAFGFGQEYLARHHRLGVVQSAATYYFFFLSYEAYRLHEKMNQSKVKIYPRPH